MMGWCAIKILLIIGILLVVMVLIIAVILALPIRIIIKYDDEAKLMFKFLGMLFGGKPKTNDSDTTTAKRAKKIIGISRFDSFGRVKGSVEKNGVSATAVQIADILMSLMGRVVWILKHCLVEKLYIKAVCSDDDAADAAMEYGAVCAVVYPLVGYIQTAMKFKESGCDVNVKCDFESTQTVFELEAVVRVRVVYLILALFYIIWNNVKARVYEQNAPEKAKG